MNSTPGEQLGKLFDHERQQPDTLSDGIVITKGDINIFKLINEYRFLRCDHLSALTGRSTKRLHRRIFKLCRYGYITSIRLPQQKHIYALGKAAMLVLVEQGIASHDLLAQRLRARELKELFLKHEMMIVELHMLLALADRTGEIRLTAWREGRDLFDSVPVVANDGINRLPIRPDAFFTLEDSRRPTGATRANFFLEADRSTTTQERFKNKILAYWYYLEQGLHAKKFNIKHCRVLTVTLTDDRARNLCELAATLLPERARKYYLFTSVNNFSLENPVPIFGYVYRSPRSPTPHDRYPLIPPPSTSLNQAIVV